MKDTFYITTPIYYANGVPHIGHSYTSLICDVLSRYNKISGKHVKFSTGVDENSQKALIAAEEASMDIETYLDTMADKHKAVWDGLGIEYTDFIRTTEPRHHAFVREVLQKSFDNGDIYEGEYEWMYCVWCEAFKKDDDLVFLNKTSKETFPISPKVKPSDNIVKICPDHLKTPDTIKEKNYFFKLSKYEDKIKKLYKDQPDFVMPSDRFNEVIAFTNRGLEDFSISRETNTFGIKLPFDESQVTYVWYDALFNYLTVCEKPHLTPTLSWEEREKLQNESASFWPADLHVVGKDIIRFHAIYWPAMLMSAGYDLPKNILTTWFFTVDGQKISKSLGNAIDPVAFTEKYSKDLLALYLLSSFNIGQDWDFDQSQAVLTYNAKLANNLGNLVNRVVVLSLKLDEKPGDLHPHSTPQSSTHPNPLLLREGIQHYDSHNLKWILDDNFKFLDVLNKYVDETEPWNLLKTDQEKAREVLYTLAEWLRHVWLHLYPFFPEKMSEMFEKLGLEWYTKMLEGGKLEELLNKKETFHIKEKWNNLFERIDIEK